MSDLRLDHKIIARYLSILGVPQRQPGLDALKQLVTAHLVRIPFENISKLYYLHQTALRALPTIHEYLDGIEQYRFGGTCYSNNFNLYRLLVSLGYQVKLCAADMNSPDVHMVSLVNIEDKEYLVDVGYAAPFLTPLPRDSPADYVVTLGRDRYVLRPQDASGCSRLELYRDGTLKHGYLAKPKPRKIDDFRQVISDSFRPDATFLNALLLTRCYPDHSVTIHNLTLIESQGNCSTVRALATRDELISEIVACFGMPRPIVMVSVADLRDLRDAWA